MTPIKTIDTDISVIILCNMPKLFQGLIAWLEALLPLQNTLPFINVNKINQIFEYSFCYALPGYHTFTGCHFTASLSGKGKVNTLK